jgi:hypothetical protein
MAEKFNKMPFTKKLETLRDNNDILTLGSDGNWWKVKTKDPYINDQLEDEEISFEIKKEWTSNEMDALVHLLGISNEDYD